MPTIDEYFEPLTADDQAEYARIKQIVYVEVPDTSELDEVVSYGVPTFKFRKRPLLYFGVFKDHYSLFPASDGLIEAVPELGKYRAGKGTLQYRAAEPISDELVRAMVKYQLSTVEA